MITEKDLETARATIAECDATIAQARPKAWLSRSASAALADARAHRAAAEEALLELTAQFKAEQAAIKDRPQVEKSYASEIAAAKKVLDAGAKRFSDAAAAAQAALVELIDAAAVHNGNIARYGPELLGWGLGLPEHAEVRTGGGPKSVRVKGKWYIPVEAGVALAWVAHRVCAARLPRIHGVTDLLAYVGGRRELDRRTDGLLAGVPDVPALHREEPLRAVAAKIESPVTEKAQREHAAKMHALGLDPATQTRMDDPSGGWPQWSDAGKEHAQR